MIAEVLAAMMVGLTALWLVLEPVWRPMPAPAAADGEPEAFEETAEGEALAALKEIEFDRQTGKLTEEDYRTLRREYEARAVALLRTASSAPAAPDVEAMIAGRVRALREGAAACPTCGPRPEPDAVFCSSCGKRVDGVTSCQGCGASLPPDGRFCARCGAAIAA